MQNKQEGSHTESLGVVLNRKENGQISQIYKASENVTNSVKKYMDYR